MGIWRMDYDTAKWIANNPDKLKIGKKMMFEVCPDCGASYFEILGHSCDNIIDLKTETRLPDGWDIINGGKD